MVPEPSQPAKSYRIVPYGDEHLSAVVELQRHLWSPDPRRNAAYLEWKYLRNPYIREPLIYLAFDGDELVGMRGAFGSRWEAGKAGDPGERFTLPYPDDLVILPAHRGRWLQQRIMAFALEDLARRGYPYVVNLSASRETAVGSLRMKWRNAGGVRPVHRRTRRERLISDLAERHRGRRFLWRWAEHLPALLLPRGDEVFARLDRRMATAARQPGAGAVFLGKAPLADDMAGLVRRLAWDGRIRHVRDEAFITWRYGNPLHDYRFLYAGGDRLDGYLVLQRLRRPGHRRVSIVDWEADDARVRAGLLAAAVDGGFPDLHTWAAGACPDAAQALERTRFTPIGSGFETSILVRSTRDDELAAPWQLAGRRLDDEAEWDVRMVYSARG